jgi:ATP-binding cassette subfamily C protein LapB
VVSQAILVVALVIGVYEIGNGAITIGALTASTLMVGRMMAPISQMLGLAHRVFELRQSARSVDQLFAAPQEKAGDGGKAGRSPVKGRIDMRGVSFTYPGETTPCLSGINLSIAPGEKVGIIGRIGSGKSTLLSLLVRLHDATQGSISLDGAEIRQFEPAAIRRAFGHMRQDSVLIDDTLKANLAIGLASIDAARLERAVAMSGVAEFAARHPNGLDLKVGPGGSRLSGGERQAVALARLLAGDPKVLLLDEPTAAMDSTLEQMVIRSLTEFGRGRTLVVATHRAPLLALVDRVILVDRGRIIADGPKDEVLARIRAAAA